MSTNDTRLTPLEAAALDEAETLRIELAAVEQQRDSHYRDFHEAYQNWQRVDAENEQLRAQVADKHEQLAAAQGALQSLGQAYADLKTENDQLRRELESSRSISRSNARNFNTLAEVIERVSKFADEMETYCSPHGVATTYAKRLREVINAPTSNEAGVTR